MEENRILSQKTVHPDPVLQFKLWYAERISAVSVYPDAVTLATSSNEGLVSSRIVLLKEFNKNGFVFFTNYNSKKGRQLLSNNKAALLFYWAESGHQIRIEGVAKKISDEKSDSYFKTRPRESQIAAWSSNQSSVIPDRNHLENKFNFYKNNFQNTSIEKPPYWGGFQIVPDWFEFWQNGEFRLHDRITYT